MKKANPKKFLKCFEAVSKAPRNIASLAAYTPGEQPKEDGWVKLNTNEFPYPPSPKVKAAILAYLSDGGDAALRLYPNPESVGLRAAIAKYFDVSAQNVIAGNGSDDILNLVMRAFSGVSLKAAAMHPSYSLYPVLAQIQDAKYVEFEFEKNFRLPFKKIFESGANLFFLTSPNAPTGKCFDNAEIEKLLKGFDGIVLVDEAYASFAPQNAVPLLKKYPNLIVAGTLSKGWALAGMRVGWALASAEIVEILDRVRDSYNIDRLAQIAGIAALEDKKYYAKFCAKVCKERDALQKFFDALGWDYCPSGSNFVLVRPSRVGLKEGKEAAASLFEYLRTQKVLVRYFAKDPAINGALRVTVGTPAQMKTFKESVLKWTKLG